MDIRFEDAQATSDSIPVECLQSSGRPHYVYIIVDQGKIDSVHTRARRARDRRDAIIAGYALRYEYELYIARAANVKIEKWQLNSTDHSLTTH